MTGLPNRLKFNHQLQELLADAAARAAGFYLMFIDLDRFKQINDTLGHESGDLVLTTVSARFLTTVGAHGLVCRLGGDEFVVLLHALLTFDEIADIAQRLLAAASDAIELPSGRCSLSASIGAARYPEHGQDQPTLMKHADIAMYRAKELGKNNVQFYSPILRSVATERRVLEANLRMALQREEMHLVFQPKVDLRSGTMTGVDVLLRWDSTALGSVTPDRFIPIAEETGLITVLGGWVLRQACLQNMTWQRQGLARVCMAVNLSTRQFYDDGLLPLLREILRESQMPGDLLELEVAESMLMHRPDSAIHRFAELRSLGVRLAIDGFGNAYASLGRLKHYPINTFKVSRAFIREIASNDDDQQLTEAIITMGRALKLTVVAEGVETTAQRNFLHTRFCDQIQRFFGSAPLRADDLAAMLQPIV